MLLPSKRSRGSQVVQEPNSLLSWRNSRRFHPATETKEDQMWFLSPVLWSAESKHSPVWTVHSHRSTVNIPLVGLWVFCRFVGWINNCLHTGQNPSIPAFLYSGKVPPCLYRSVFVSKLDFVRPTQRVSFPRALFYIVEPNLDLFCLFVCFFIYIICLFRFTFAPSRK